jgi:hypothetical protein
MDNKNYTLVIRTGTGVWDSKTKVNCDIHMARLILDAMLRAHPKSNRGEIIDGDRDYIMDSRVKPLVKVIRREDGIILEDNNN